LNAEWNGDASWSATIALPSDTRGRLSIDFFNLNGDMYLGSFEEPFRTGTNAAETYTVTADRFFTAWDDDGDGTSNIEELPAGTDPSFDEASDDPIRDAFRIGGLEEVNEAIRDESGFFEAILPEHCDFSDL